MDKELASIKVKLDSYYKYSFTFKNELGYTVSAGGISDEMYRCSLKVGKEYTIQEVASQCGGSLYVYFNNELIYEDAW